MKLGMSVSKKNLNAASCHSHDGQKGVHKGVMFKFQTVVAGIGAT